MTYNPSDDTDTGDASDVPTPAQAAARVRREREEALAEAERVALATPRTIWARWPTACKTRLACLREVIWLRFGFRLLLIQ